MANLRKLTLSKNPKKDTWDLTEDKTEKVVKRFQTKQEAVQGGVLEKALGKEGGSVKIKKVDNTYQEERTFPGNNDPKESIG